MTAVLERPAPVEARPSGGGAPARRAVARWSWRLFRREWRQQLLVLALLTLAMAATTLGLAVATNTVVPPATTFTLSGADPHLATDLAAFARAFPDGDVLADRQVRIPGLAGPVDLRSPTGPGATQHPFGSSERLVAGRAPVGAGQVALTRTLADELGLHLGSDWTEGGQTRRLVGTVENPTDLGDQFALLAPGQLDHPTSITVRVPANARSDAFRLPSGTPLAIQSVASDARQGAAIGVLVIATLGMIFVGLMAVAGFTVMAHRRLRALGMLSSIGATTRHVRLVMLVDGFAVGTTAALVGAAIGVVAWLGFAPRLESFAGHRIDRFALPWWAIAVAMVLAVATAVLSAWWPARTVARIPVVAALSGRPPRPQPPRRFALAGVGIGVVGLALLIGGNQRNPVAIPLGILATVVGMLLLAPVVLAGVARLGGHLPLAPRLAIRDLARHQARSGAALGAVTLALGLAAVIAITATDAQASSGSGVGNLADNQLLVWLTPAGFGSPVPSLTAADLTAAETQVSAMASAVGARSTLALDVAVSGSDSDTQTPLPVDQGAGSGGLLGGSKSAATAQPGSGSSQQPPAALVHVTGGPHGGIDEQIVAPLFVATPAVAAHYGIDPASVPARTDVLSSRTDLAGVKVDDGQRRPFSPVIRRADLSRYDHAPNSLITPEAVDRLGLHSRPMAWLIETSGPLTAKQLSAARRLGVAAQMPVESRDTKASLTQLRRDATLVGVLLALAVLAMTVGLVHSEAANDLRTLTAAGASSRTRRALTGATAGLLALLGAVSGTVAAYLALAAWYHRDLHHLTHVPVQEMLVILIGLPVVAGVGGWVLAGRQPPAIARRPLD